LTEKSEGLKNLSAKINDKARVDRVEQRVLALYWTLIIRKKKRDRKMRSSGGGGATERLHCRKMVGLCERNPLQIVADPVQRGGKGGNIG